MRPISNRAAARFAWSTLIVSLPLAVLTAVTGLLDEETTRGALAYNPETVFVTVAWLVFIAVGALVLSGRPGRAAGWLLWATGFLAVVGDFLYRYAVHTLFVRPGSLPLGREAAWLAVALFASPAITFGLALLTVPEGRLPRSRSRFVAWLLFVCAGIEAVTPALTWRSRGPLLLDVGSGNIGVGVADVLVALERHLVPSAMTLAAAILLFRLYRARSDERPAIRWLAYSAPLVTVPLLLVFEGVQSRSLDVLFAIGIFGFAIAAAMTVLRYRLFDVDIVVRKSLVYGALSVMTGALYLGVAASLGISAGHRLPIEIAILVTVAATLLFQPVRRWLDRLAGRLVFGERPTGYELLSQFGETLEHALEPGELAARIADTVRRGLDLRWARVLLQIGEGKTRRLEPAGAAGVDLDDEASPAVTVPLSHADEEVGVIECGPKSEGRFGERDHELLRTLARQAALGIRNARLAAELSARLEEIRRQAEELAASRVRLVQAQDAERRRLERDIHDGIQQEMVSLIAQLRLARNHVGSDPGEVEAALQELQAEATQTLEELRELARGIHPPVLAARGLLEAIEDRAGRIPLGVDIQAHRDFRSTRFPDEIETTAYFFVSEALANVLKHAHASQATVHLWTGEGRLRVEVSDDGVGFDTAAATGSGLAGLRDRIEIVGGTMLVESAPGKGATMSADLPGPIRERAHA